MYARILQEVRLIRWPWFLMTLAGLIPLLKLFLVDKRSDLPEGVAVFGFFGGAAVLTALSFQDALRISLLAPTCDQRVSRYKLWSEKMAVLMGAAACAGLIACSGQALSGNLAWRDITANAIEPVLLLVIIVCSTGFWTMLTRSMAGGILLTVVAQFVLYLLLMLFATGIDRMAPANPGATRLSHVPEVHSALSWFVGGFGLSYAAIMLWLGRQRFTRLQPRENVQQNAIVKRFIRNLSKPTEFCLIIFICFGLSIAASSIWIIKHLRHVPPTHTNSVSQPNSKDVIHLKNDGIVVSAILEFVTLGGALWIGRIRGWSLATFGFRPSWKGTGTGVLLFVAFHLVEYLIRLLTNGFHPAVPHGTGAFLRVSHLTLPFIILTSTVNPVFEEAIESGYFFHALQRYGMWLTVFTAAFFRGFLHVTMGFNGFATMFAMGLLYGFVYWRWRQLWPLILAHSLQMFYALLPQAFP